MCAEENLGKFWSSCITACIFSIAGASRSSNLSIPRLDPFIKLVLMSVTHNFLTITLCSHATLSEFMSHTTHQIRTALQNVIDPELGISIVDLGLIYDVTFPTETTVKILMTLTSMGCPLFGTIQLDVYKALESLGYTTEQVEIELTFDPPWNQEKMSEIAKAELGID